MNNDMTLAQFLEYQRILERTASKKQAKHIRSIMQYANVTNPFVPGTHPTPSAEERRMSRLGYVQR